MADVIAAVDEMQNSNTVKVLKSLRKMERLVMISIYLASRGNNQEKVHFDAVQGRALTLLGKLRQSQLRVQTGRNPEM